jgi:hypothetical protein
VWPSLMSPKVRGKISSEGEAVKTLADIRRRAVTGARLEVIEQTKYPELVGTVRTIEHATSGPSYKFTSDDDPLCVVYRATWPKAGEVRIIDGDTFEYDLRRGAGVIRLRFLPPVA